MPFAHTDHTKRRAFHAIDAGESISATARKLNVTRKTLYVWIQNRAEIERKLKTVTAAERIADDGLAPPLFREELSREAARALEDFGYWRRRYLGLRSTPWQEEAGLAVVGWLQAPHTEFVVVNCPPGSGKSQLFVHDIPAWMICRDRTIRVLLGHRVSREAQRYTMNLRRTLGRTRPLPAGAYNVAAEGVLAQDYGRFKPTYNDAWRNEEFMVMMSIDEDTPDESGLTNKEPTVASYGMESEFLGTRANLVIWDDLVSEDLLRTSEQIDKQRRWWQSTGQTRVEPGGCLILQGQRMGGDDLYRYALDQKLRGENGVVRSRYRHIVFAAHDDDHCKGVAGHGRAPEDPGELSPTPVEQIPPYPKGCLLDPYRIPWYGTNGLAGIKENTPAAYEIQYQQRDLARTEILIPKIFIDGGRDHDGTDYPGCWDRFRSVGDIPRGLAAPWTSVVSVDPSASNYWAVGWWILHPASFQAFLVDLHRERMAAPDFLDWNANDGVFYGLLNDWVIRSKTVGAKISHVIMEFNACQKWLRQYDHYRRWETKWGITTVNHTTTSNKNDPEYGVQSVRDWYRYGRIRLPGKGAAREIVAPLVEEATRYEPAKPKARSDDTLMMTWFMTLHYQRIAKLSFDREVTHVERPSWAAA